MSRAALFPPFGPFSPRFPAARLRGTREASPLLRGPGETGPGVLIGFFVSAEAFPLFAVPGTGKTGPPSTIAEGSASGCAGYFDSCRFLEASGADELPVERFAVPREQDVPFLIYRGLIV